MSLKNACSATIDCFMDLSGSDSKRREMYMELAGSLLAFVLSVLIISFIGKWLWNNVVIELFSFAKPVRNVWQIIGLMVFLSLLK